MASQTGRSLVTAQQLGTASDPVAEAHAVTRWEERPVLVEFPASVAVTELIGTFADVESGDTRLTGVISVVDAAHLMIDLHCDAYTSEPTSAGVGDYVARAVIAASQLEYASAVVLVNWTAVPARELSTIAALVSHLSPQAAVRVDWDRRRPIRTDSAYSLAQERPGWVGLLNGDFRPRLADSRVAAFRYECVRPLHPGRLEDLLHNRIDVGEFGTVVRSAGFCRFATRPRVVAKWDHVGTMISFEPAGTDESLDEQAELLAVGQDLAFIGLDLRCEALASALDGAALSDAELVAGSRVWRTYPDPFPRWPTVSGRTD
ncbi:GTP-binding protein [Gordonia sp. (in: high G+C Gram-positive bacteria)]|uniref:GTP-binding protein n=1 Tax=Gordonia sp. (in: high G+C Gram-positive bacteria) TaxID=84139 RepID=UPI0039E34BE4